MRYVSFALNGCWFKCAGGVTRKLKSGTNAMKIIQFITLALWIICFIPYQKASTQEICSQRARVVTGVILYNIGGLGLGSTLIGYGVVEDSLAKKICGFVVIASVFSSNIYYKVVLIRKLRGTLSE